jgi:hypothetical protein
MMELQVMLADKVIPALQVMTQTVEHGMT